MSLVRPSLFWTSHLVVAAMAGMLVPAAAVAGPRPGDPAAPLREVVATGVDVLDLDLRVALDPAGKVQGEATYHIRQLRPGAPLVLDAVGLTLTATERMDGTTAVPLATALADGKLTVPLPADGPEYHIRLRWLAEPRRGMQFVRPDADAPKRPLHVWTQGETEEARYWLPAPDDPAERLTWTVHVTAPEAWTVLGNGVPAPAPRGVKALAGFKLTSHRLDQPAPIYLLSIAAGPFVPIVHPHPKHKLTTWALPEHVRDAKVSYAATPAIMDALEHVTGLPYPWGPYGHVIVEDFWHGGMENVTLSTLTHRAVPDAKTMQDWDPDGLIAHELAHQWFGNWRTCQSWADLWLNEAFASYFDALVVEKRFGQDKFAEDLDGLRASYLGEAAEYERPIVTDRMADPDDLFDRHTYNKGALVVHMLRRQVGDAAFFAGIKAYLQQGPTGAETDDLRRALEKTSHQSLRTFFARWLREPGHPVVTAAVSWSVADSRWSLKLTQKPSAGQPFALRIPVHVWQGGKEAVHTVALNGPDATLTLPLPARPDRFELDPQLSQLVEWKWEAEVADLAAMRDGGSTAEVRQQAVRGLGAKPADAAAMAALLRAAKDDKARHVRVAAASALGSSPRAQTEAGLLALLQLDPEPKVRAAAATALGDQRNPASAVGLQQAVQQDRSDAVVRAALSALAKVDRTKALPVTLATLNRPSFRHNLAAHALGVLGQLGTATDAPRLLAALAAGQPKERREAAATALATLAVRTEPIRESARLALEALLHEPNVRLRQGVVRGLTALSDPASRGPLLAAAGREVSSRTAEQMRQAADGLGKALPAEARIKKLEEAVEKLQQQHGPGSPLPPK
jgi:aminopeptidase N